MCEALEPDVVLMDIAMPVMGGIEALRKLKRERDCRARVVMLSGIVDPATIYRCTDLGAEAFIPKPFSINQVREVLDRILWQDRVNGSDPGRRSARKSGSKKLERDGGQS